MPNVKGSNQFAREQPYGAAQKLTQLTKAAPISGAPTPALNTPQRAQRQAVRGRPQAAPAAAPVAPQSPPTLSYQAQIADVWRQIAAHTDDPLVLEYAAKAQQR